MVCTIHVSLMNSFCRTQKLVWLDVDRTGLINATFICLIVDLFSPPKFVHFFFFTV